MAEHGAREAEKRLSGLVALTLLFIISSPPLFAFDLAPFDTTNRSPLAHVFGLPAGGGAAVLPAGAKEFRLTVEHASNFVQEATSRELLVLDGEQTRLSFGARVGLGRNLEVGIEIPYLSHQGGFLDGFLINYHDLLGLPQGGRDAAPRNRLLYTYWRDGVQKLRLESNADGLGDLRLTGGWQLYRDGGRYPLAVALRASLKLPTGESESLLGSGGTDGALWLTIQQDFPLPIGSGAIFASAGYLVMSQGDVMPQEQRPGAAFGGFGLAWKPLSWLGLKAQLDGHSALFKGSDLKPLGAAAQLTLGGTLGLSERLSLDIGVAEDIATTTAPDAVFHFNVRLRF